jgi:2-C-methyl-D-erythritol 2,4-cyclodiphosphate synthase
MIKVGLGYDIHRLVKGRPLYLGGIEIPYPKGLLGFSDGDCLIHALMDALLGAMGGKDIGCLFPDTDSKYKDIRSTRLLETVALELKERNYKILNVDSLLIAQQPRLSDYLPRMKETLSSILEIRSEVLSIKPRTNEGLGEIGKGEAIAAWATVLIESKSSRQDGEAV